MQKEEGRMQWNFRLQIFDCRLKTHSFCCSSAENKVDTPEFPYAKENPEEH
jgi:hypothetical protein